jgi:hypothetical protein
VLPECCGISFYFAMRAPVFARVLPVDQVAELEHARDGRILQRVPVTHRGVRLGLGVGGVGGGA